MSNLTEGILLNNYIANSRKPEDNEWYDRVYLCYEDTDFEIPKNYLPIKGSKEEIQSQWLTTHAINPISTTSLAIHKMEICLNTKE